MNAVIKMRVGVFDSGLGGLTVLEALIKKNPQKGLKVYFFVENGRKCHKKFAFRYVMYYNISVTYGYNNFVITSSYNLILILYFYCII